VADDSLSERALDLLGHLCALAAFAFVARGATLLEGWTRVEPAQADAELPLLSIVVPARNEARTIARCVRSLLAQQLARFEVIVVDDRSDDGTGAILEELARDEPRLRVIRGEPLPDGWVGKPWALEQGVRASSGDWLLFTDADTWHAPNASVSSLSFARRHDLDALSLWAHQEMESWGERAVLPTVLGLVLFATGSIRQLNDPRDTEHALANGQYILSSRACYQALGGHAALRGEIVEDIAFARRLKADGRFRLAIADGSDLVRVRMYRSLGEVWNGFTKNTYVAARGDLRALAGAAAFLSLLSVVPVALAVDGLARRRPLRSVEALATLGGTIAIEAYLLQRIGLRASLAVFAPAGFAASAGILLTSTVSVLSGRGVTWRGRRYTGRVAGERP
jgi:chlorobactene glucosyltransferase